MGRVRAGRSAPPARAGKRACGPDSGNRGVALEIASVKTISLSVIVLSGLIKYRLVDSSINALVESSRGSRFGVLILVNHTHARIGQACRDVVEPY